MFVGNMPCEMYVDCSVFLIVESEFALEMILNLRSRPESSRYGGQTDPLKIEKNVRRKYAVWNVDFYVIAGKTYKIALKNRKT